MADRPDRPDRPDGADLAHALLRTVVRAFYQTEHILVIEALIIHSTLPDTDLAHVLGMQSKALHRVCGRLKEDGLVSVVPRAERRTDGSSSYHTSGPNGSQQKERFVTKQWYWIHYHHAIDAVKYRMYKLSKYVESLGAPATEKKDLSCPRCKAQWTELEVMDRIDSITGAFLCGRCGHELDPVEDDERVNENESMKRLNSQLEPILRLMQQIDANRVSEHDFKEALQFQIPIVRSDAHPGQRTETIDLPKHNVQNSKGLEIKPERIAVQLQNDEDVKRAHKEAEEQERREKEARQNALPEWIAKSTVTGDTTAVGAKEEMQRREREAGAVLKAEDEGEEKKPTADTDADVMEAYWAEVAKAQQQAAEQAAEDEEEEEEDDDEFEDVEGLKTAPAVLSARNGAETSMNGTSVASTGANTPALESSNATDDERDAKRVKVDAPTNGGLAVDGKGAEDTPAASDEDEDDEMEFENVV
jgi:transcription initiation factor TFIIE subunit alpha